MVMAMEVAPGIFFDLRAAVLAVGAFFSGPVVAAIAVALAGIYRVAEGGVGMPLGLIHIAGAALLGIVARTAAGSPLPGAHWIVILGFAVAALVLSITGLLPPSIDTATRYVMMPPMALLSFLATLLMGLAILRARRSGRERRVLETALSQAPEFIYVKDRQSRFIAANDAVARNGGFATPGDLIGKSEFDFLPAARAQRIYEQEQQTMDTGEPLLDFEESVEDGDGAPRWYRTTKVPVRDSDGKIVGLSGVTVDTTVLKRLERDLIESRDRLSLALTEMSDGFAVFDAEGYLLFCNEQYRDAFPLSAHVRVAGAHIDDILRVVAETGEQAGVPRDDIDGWVQRVGSLLRVPNDVAIELFDGRYLQIRNRPASNGTALVVVSDVTDIKKAEQALIAANIDLSHLAATDPLTGLANRRRFDETLARDMALTGRAGTPLSLILIDVDHFKTYNDTYGHQSGDDCLRLVARSILACLRRGSDLASRYGGEEFAVILPDTDLEGAVAVADEIRTRITTASVEELGRRVSASLGVAEYELASAPSTPEDLVRRADGALYGAKIAGRDRVHTAP
jgi:diguanylate cyclase (GGDEF)-like protein/PAS domain S-box-containing protein